MSRSGQNFSKDNINPCWQVMDLDTLLLLIMLIAAFCWWFKLRLDDNKKLSKELERREKARLARQKRVRQLTNRR